MSAPINNNLSSANVSPFLHTIPATNNSAPVAAAPAASVSLPEGVTTEQSGQLIEESAELLALHNQVIDSAMPQELKTRSIGMLNRLEKLAKFGFFTKEFEPVEKYISWVTKVPWDKASVDNLDIKNVRAQLDKTHYGMTEVKERILEYVAMINLLAKRELEHPEIPLRKRAPVICFVGVQGIGKTTVAKSIAAALGRKFVRVPLGGMADIRELRGIPKSEMNSEPGQILKAFIHSGVMNPLLLLDEVDKVSEGNNVHADIMAALLEILDPEQNYEFSDHYIDFPVDLSRCIFICTANNLGGISAALLDRLEVVRMSSYSDDEKQHIAKEYLLPKVMSESGLNADQLVFREDVWPLVIRPLGFDAGIRQLERNLTSVVRKIAKKVVMGEASNFEVTPDNFREYFPLDIGVYS